MLRSPYSPSGNQDSPPILIPCATETNANRLRAVQSPKDCHLQQRLDAQAFRFDLRTRSQGCPIRPQTHCSLGKPRAVCQGVFRQHRLPTTHCRKRHGRPMPHDLSVFPRRGDPEFIFPSTQLAREGESITGTRPLASRTAVGVVEAHDIVLSKIGAGLNLDHLQRQFARVLQPMPRAYGNVG